MMSMKRVLFSCLLIALLWGSASIAWANGQGDGIVGSPHDFSAEDWNQRDEICRVCHVPHDHNKNEDLFMLGLLWNHELSSENYVMYAEYAARVPDFVSFIDGAFETEPIGITKMCLGCHDGTVALDAFDKYRPGTDVFIQTEYDAGFQVPGGDINRIGGNLNLVGSHPYSIVYDEIADKGLHPKSTVMWDTVNTIEDVLDRGRIACSSCHDVHDSPGEAVPNTHLLRVPQKLSQGGPASGLCLTCHNK